jgi:hypothetical protein
MKPISLILSTYYILLILSCEPEDKGCTFDTTVPSQHKDYVPYNTGEELIFQTSFGEYDTLIVANSKIDTIQSSRFECQLHERIKCDIAIITKDTSNYYEKPILQFHDNLTTSNSLLIYVDDGDFLATDSGGSSNEFIELFPLLELNGITYYDALLAHCQNPVNCKFIDSLCFVKNQGLVFYTINGVKRTKI